MKWVGLWPGIRPWKIVFDQIRMKRETKFEILLKKLRNVSAFKEVIKFHYNTIVFIMLIVDHGSMYIYHVYISSG